MCSLSHWRAPVMRLSVSRWWRVVKGESDDPVRAPRRSTSSGGMGRDAWTPALSQRRSAGDALLWPGAPVHQPHRGRLLRQFAQETLAPLIALNRDLVTEAWARLESPRLTIDVDDSVVRTGGPSRLGLPGLQPPIIGRPRLLPAVRPCGADRVQHPPQEPPRNVHDSKQAVPVRRDIIDDLRPRFGRRVALEFRLGAAFFQRGVLQLLTARACGYAIKVGYWSWLLLKAIAAGGRWCWVAPGMAGYETEPVISQWQPHGARSIRRPRGIALALVRSRCHGCPSRTVNSIELGGHPDQGRRRGGRGAKPTPELVADDSNDAAL